MANTPQTTTEFAKAIDPAVHKHFDDGLKQLKPQFSQVLHTMTQKDYNEIHANYSGVGSLSVVGEGEVYAEDAKLQTYYTTYTPTKYGRILPVTIELQQWSKVKSITDMAKAAAKAAVRKQEKIAADVFNKGFNTSYTSLSSGKPLFSTDQTRADGGTAQSNASATGITLTEANLETAMLAGENQLDERGEAIEVYFDTLLVPPSLRKEALIIAQSDLRSNTANNDINVYNKNVTSYPGAAIGSVVCWQYLRSGLGGSDTAWFLLDSTGHQINFLWGEKTNISRDESSGFDNDTIKYKVRFQASTGWDDWRNAYGSKGDGAAYAN